MDKQIFKDRLKIKSFKSLDKKSKIKLAILLVAFILAFIGALFAFGALGIIKTSPKTNLSNLSASFDQTSTIYNEHGDLLENVEAKEYRTIVSLKQIPDSLVKAIVSIEDQRFYKHPGIDLKSIMGSFITNLKAGRIVRGGSTLTQQLVKNVYLTNDRDFDRKIKEAYLALRVESHLSKDEILEAYLNRINLGQGAYGVQAAAWTYFSKDVSELSLAESALLAGIAKSPAEYPPIKRYSQKDLKGNEEILASGDISGENMYFVKNEKAFERQKIVLNKMLQLGVISKKDYEVAIKENTAEHLKPGLKKFHTMSSYSSDYIAKGAIEIISNFYKVSPDEAQHKFFTGGFKIFTSIDERMQEDTESLFKNFYKLLSQGSLNYKLDNSSNIIDKNGDVIYFNRWGFFDQDFNLKLAGKNFEKTPSGDLLLTSGIFTKGSDNLDLVDIWEEIDDRLNTYSVGSLRVPKDQVEIGLNYINIKSSFLKDKKDFYKEENGSITISKKYFQIDEKPSPQPQGAGLIIENETGLVRAIVGGLDVKSSSKMILNRALSQRSPGSALKPLSVMAPLLKKDTLASIQDDIPIIVDGEIIYKNPYPGYKGLLTLRRALEYNSNTAFVKFFEKLGMNESLNFLKELGYDYVDHQKDNYKNDETADSLALGNMVKGLSLEELTRGYLTIARDGAYIEPSCILKIEDSSGSVIYEHKKKEREILDKKIAFLLKSALSTNASRGFSKGVKLRNYATAGCLGVNKFNSTIFYEGFTPYYTLGIYVGADSPKIGLTNYEEGSIDLFREMSKIAHRNLPAVKEFQVPQGIIQKYICEKSGMLGTTICEEVEDGILEYFIAGTEPTQYCKGHIKLEICKDSDRLFGLDCPKKSKEEKIFFKREPEYIPSKYKGILPDDYQYVPELYCNVHGGDK